MANKYLVDHSFFTQEAFKYMIARYALTRSEAWLISDIMDRLSREARNCLVPGRTGIQYLAGTKRIDLRTVGRYPLFSLLENRSHSTLRLSIRRKFDISAAQSLLKKGLLLSFTHGKANKAYLTVRYSFTLVSHLLQIMRAKQRTITAKPDSGRHLPAGQKKAVKPVQQLFQLTQSQITVFLDLVQDMAEKYPVETAIVSRNSVNAKERFLAKVVGQVVQVPARRKNVAQALFSLRQRGELGEVGEDTKKYVDHRKLAEDQVAVRINDKTAEIVFLLLQALSSDRTPSPPLPEKPTKQNLVWIF